jgi:hypothetical protein
MDFNGTVVNVILVFVNIMLGIGLVFAWYSRTVAGYIAALFTARAAGLSSLQKTQARTHLQEQIRFGLVSPPAKKSSARRSTIRSRK